MAKGGDNISYSRLEKSCCTLLKVCLSPMFFVLLICYKKEILLELGSHNLRVLT